MLNLMMVKRLVVAQWQVDFRKGHLGLLGECRLAGLEPWAGDCIVFISRCRTRMKLLFADNNGLWVAYKQFAKGTIATQIDILQRPATKVLSFSDLTMLLEGHQFVVTRRKQNWQPKHLIRDLI